MKKIKEYHKNPRKITSELLRQLEDNLLELGDLSGITHDLNTDEIITGNQRSKVVDLNNCEIVITERFKKADKQGTVAIGYVIWEGFKLNYRQVRWNEEQREKANITANSITGLWDQEMIKQQWKDVAGISDWNLPFVIDLPPVIDSNVVGVIHTSNKFHDTKPLIFISLNLVQRRIEVPEPEAKQFLNSIIDLTRMGEQHLQTFYDELYRFAFDHIQEYLTTNKK